MWWLRQEVVPVQGCLGRAGRGKFIPELEVFLLIASCQIDPVGSGEV